MRKIFFTIVILLQAVIVFSQKSNFIFFTEQGELFTLSLNGISYNNSPQTNVKAAALNPGLYSVKITFADPSLRSVIEQINLDAGAEITFVVKHVSSSGIKKFGKGLFSTKPDSVIQKEKEQVDKSDGKYVLE